MAFFPCCIIFALLCCYEAKAEWILHLWQGISNNSVELCLKLTHYVDKDDLELLIIPASTCQMLGFWVCIASYFVTSHSGNTEWIFLLLPWKLKWEALSPLHYCSMYKVTWLWKDTGGGGGGEGWQLCSVSC